jgi:hypothetical protein
VPNDHIAFFPRKHADIYFYMGKQFRECEGKFTASLASELVSKLIVDNFPIDSVDTGTVVPYNLNRHGTPEGICERIKNYAENLGNTSPPMSFWMERCQSFTSWFGNITELDIEHGVSVINSFWASRDSINTL